MEIDLTQQAISMFSKASETFENNFSNKPIVRSFLDDYVGYCESRYDETISLFPEDDPNCHKSLGCFFDVATEQLSKFLKASSTGAIGFNAAQSFFTYVILVDTLWQSMLDVYAVFTVTDGSRPYKLNCRLDALSGDDFFKRINARYLTEENVVMYQMSRWAKFLRQPKGLGWLLHQPQYVFADSEELKKIQAEETRFTLRLIDDEFIRKNYPSNTNDDRVYESYKFERKKVVIVMPDLENLTKEICSCLSSFLEVVGPYYCIMLNKTRKRMQEETIE